ncbi:MAG TPA: hypothetical protein VF681_02710 [Abditibacteriaceae bacterium]|jgi:hypothetical protein
MSIDTRTHQGHDDTAPEGREPDARQNVPSGVTFDRQVPPQAQPESDSLPMDGSLTLNDTEPQDQSGQHPDGNRILMGNESSATADSAIETSDAAEKAIADKDRETTQSLSTPDPPAGQVATGGQ